MKKIVLLVGAVLVLSVTRGQAQTIAQVTSQLLLDIQKLAELKSILKEMYTAYTVVDKGYTNIESIVKGNFNLHKAFLDGLLAVSPAVREYSRVADIINTEYRFVVEYKSAYSSFSESGRFTTGELDNMNTVYTNLFNRSLGCLRELAMLVTDDDLRMSDGDRLKGIDRVYADITGQLGLLEGVNASAAIVAAQRAREANDIGTMQSIYGINH